MIYLIIMYILFSVLLIIKNHRNHSIIWYTLMLIGFTTATFGLSLYTTYILGSTFSDNALFYQVEEFLLKLNYYLDLDISEQFRIMNIGTAIYIYGAISYAVSFSRKRRLSLYIGLAVGPLLLSLIYDPYFLEKLYGLDTYTIYEVSIQSISNTMVYVNYLFNGLIKCYLLGAILIMIVTYWKTPVVIRAKYKYTMFGILPIWALFALLFFYFPNHNIIYRRYEQLYMYNFTYNPYLYHTITYLSILSFVLLLVATFRYNVFDAMERKKQIRFNQQYETANIGLRVFTHAIKNQFVAIKLLAESLQRMEEAEPQMRQEIVEEMREVCQAAISKLSDLNENTKKIQLHYKVLIINDLIEKSMSKIGVSFIAIDAPCLLRISIDEEQFMRVIDNLLLNAVEALKGNEHPRITIHLRDSLEYGIVEIEDNGCGISKKDLKKVIRPFYTTKPTVTNWGVGLAFCQRAIDAFGGTIHIESEVNEGTKVAIYLPKERRS